MEDQEKIENSQIFLSNIHQAINMQVIGLALIVAFYNLHRTLEKLEEKHLVITMGGLKYTGNTKALRRRNLLEEKY